MAELAKSDVFFMITSAAVVILTVIIAVLLIYIFIVVRNVKKVIEKVKVESDLLLDDIRELRVKLKTEGGTFRRASALFAFFKGAFLGKKR
jgi:hypothetical protein